MLNVKHVYNLQAASASVRSLNTAGGGGLRGIANHRVCIMHLLPWFKICSRLKKGEKKKMTKFILSQFRGRSADLKKTNKQNSFN